MAKPLRPFFPYFGAKWRLGKHYPAPVYDTVVELYAGSACYSLHHHEKRVILCEAFAPVAALWKYLIGCAQRGDIASIEALPDLGDRSVDDFGLEPGARALIGFWCQVGKPRPCTRLSTWARTAAKGELYWGPRVRERLVKQLPAIRHWTILEGRYQDVAPYEPHATYFIDPPYQVAGKEYSVNDVDYRDLAVDCRMACAEGAQVIVCEAEGADWLPFRSFRTTGARTAEGKGRVSKEVIWP